MGAAKKRGTFEQRVAEAKSRNTQMVKAINEGNNLQMQAVLRHTTPQRFATVLVNAQLLVRN
jgi:hypothetical protein